jgi:hypothetical protein
LKGKIKKYKVIILVAIAAVALAFYFSSQSTCADGLVPCKNDCNLCYLLVGFSNIFQWLSGSLLITATVLGITVGGLSYIIAGVFPKALAFAQQALLGSLRGFAFALCGWLIVNAVMNIAGWKGANWWQHDCSGKGSNQTVGSDTNNGSKCDSKNKKLESVVIQCAEQTENIKDNGVGFYVALDTLSGDEKGKTKQLKAIGKYYCDGTTSEEDITSQAEWKASDETQIKVAKGLVQAVTTSLGSSSESAPYVEAKFQDKNSNQAKVYINSCPNTTASIETNDKFSLRLDSFLIPKAYAEPDSAKFNASESTNSNNENNKAGIVSTIKNACVQCGIVNTCHLLKGDPGADFVFILMRNNEYMREGETPCDPNMVWKYDWNNDEELLIFSELASGLAQGYERMPKFTQSKLAIYKSDRIGARDYNCPTGNIFTSYGYVHAGIFFGGHAWAQVPMKAAGFAGNDGIAAEYCSGGEIATANSLAHEQGGHILGALDDEYTSTLMDPNKFIGGSHYNCTQGKPKWGPPPLMSDSVPISYDWGRKCQSKWNGLGASCEKGCLYTTNGLYRSIVNGIMNDHREATEFGAVDSKIIDLRVGDWPLGAEKSPDDFSEQFDPIKYP